MTTTTGVLFFPSGYTRSVSTERSPCFTVTHSRWRGDFSSVALAQSCAEAKGAAPRISVASKAVRFMAWFPPGESRWLELGPEACVLSQAIVMRLGNCRKSPKLPGNEMRQERCWSYGHGARPKGQVHDTKPGKLASLWRKP